MIGDRVLAWLVLVLWKNIRFAWNILQQLFIALQSMTNQIFKSKSASVYPYLGESEVFHVENV